MATTVPDGSPQLTQTWVDTDGVHVLINTVRGHQKARNIERDRRVALTDSVVVAVGIGFAGHLRAEGA